MPVTDLAKPGDMKQTFDFTGPGELTMFLYGITTDGKIYRRRRSGQTWVDTALVIPAVADADA